MDRIARRLEAPSPADRSLWTTHQLLTVSLFSDLHDVAPRRLCQERLGALRAVYPPRQRTVCRVCPGRSSVPASWPRTMRARPQISRGTRVPCASGLHLGPPTLAGTLPPGSWQGSTEPSFTCVCVVCGRRHTAWRDFPGRSYVISSALSLGAPPSSPPRSMRHKTATQGKFR